MMDYEEVEMGGCVKKGEMMECVMKEMGRVKDICCNVLEEEWLGVIDGDGEKDVNVMDDYDGGIMGLWKEGYGSEERLDDVVNEVMKDVGGMGCGEGGMGGWCLMGSGIKVEEGIEEKVEKWGRKFGV